LFVGFVATMAASDFSRSCIGGYGSSPSRRGPVGHLGRRSIGRSPGSRARSVRTCQGLRPRRADQALALACLVVSPSAPLTASAPGNIAFSWLNGWPVHSPADAAPSPSRATPHGSGPVWVATPSP
jgi:hypothetical protein